MGLDLEKVRANVRKATTEDLLDRATVYRGGMEPEALEVIDEELRARGVVPDASRMRGPEGWPRVCQACGRPATWQGWTWGRLWGVLPMFPRQAQYCDEHRPRGDRPGEPAA
ncbi:MAG TPA: hypothetical protein VFE78_39960 [Gemmataceae bacterium]|jgi:hypothetical protein|nr:hypothetical protein [Gemmataceae bacterium]